MQIINDSYSRFRVEVDEAQNLARVVDVGTQDKPTRIPLTDWVVQEAALVMRHDYATGPRKA